LLRSTIFDDRLKISSGSIQNPAVEDFWRIDLAVRSGSDPQQALRRCRYSTSIQPQQERCAECL